MLLEFSSFSAQEVFINPEIHIFMLCVSLLANLYSSDDNLLLDIVPLLFGDPERQIL